MGVPTTEDILLNPTPWKRNFIRNGLYRGTVVSVNDPQARGRVQIRITLLHPASSPPGFVLDSPNEESNTLSAPPGEGVPDEACPWAEPCLPVGGFTNETRPEGLQSEGFFALPSVGSTVWVGFEGGFIGKPVWLGCWLKSGDLPEEISDPANIRLFKTPAGHILLFDDTPGSRKILIATPSADNTGLPHTVRFLNINDQEGKTTLKDGEHTIILDSTAQQVSVEANGGTSSIIMTNQTVTITMGAITITLDSVSGNITSVLGANFVLDAPGIVSLGLGASLGVMLDTFIALFNAHTHTGVTTGPGVTGPPSTPAVLGTHSSATVLAKP